MFAIFDSDADLEEAITSLVGKGLIDKTNIDRLRPYPQLRKNGDVDFFSVRSVYLGVSVYIHFVPYTVAQSIAKLEQPRVKKTNDNVDIVYIRDLRPTRPTNVKLNGGYPTPNICAVDEDSLFVPRVKKISNEESDNYLSESTVWGSKDSNNDYYMGVMSFFMAVSPVVLTEKNNKVTELIKQHQQNIAQRIGKKQLVNLPRQQLMPSYIVDEIQQTIT